MRPLTSSPMTRVLLYSHLSLSIPYPSLKLSVYSKTHILANSHHQIFSTNSANVNDIDNDSDNDNYNDNDNDNN